MPTHEELIAYIDTHKALIVGSFVLATLLTCGVAPHVIMAVTSCDQSSQDVCDNAAADRDASRLTEWFDRSQASLPKNIL